MEVGHCGRQEGGATPQAGSGGMAAVGGWPWQWFAFLHEGMTWTTLFSLETLWIILPYSLILAAVGLIESLMSTTLIDEITTRSHGNRECVGQGGVAWSGASGCLACATGAAWFPARVRTGERPTTAA